MAAVLTSSWERWLLDPLVAALFPSTCVVCSEPLCRPTRGPICGPCVERLPRHAGAQCTCGQRLLCEAGQCARCRRRRNSLAAGASLGPHEGSLRLAIHALKYRGHRRVAPQLASALWSTPAVKALIDPGALLVPVPLGKRRRHERGFNQAELVARALARMSGARLVPGALVRRRSTPPQTQLSARARRANVRGAFAAPRPARLRNRIVVLVDDVYTTGATARECARVLKAAGAAEVRVVTAARTA
jgi:ComF family protein